MNLKPTNVPLTAKDFDEVRCGLCMGCGCGCGYIAYLKGGKIEDIYGHPHDPNGIGSLCSKGLALLQEAPYSSFRVTNILRREGGSFAEATIDQIKEFVKGKKKVGIFLDRLTDLKDYAYATAVTENVYSDSLFLPFKPSTIPPQRWRDQRFILALECEPVFSEVMATRWLVDAFERSSYIVSVSSRFATTSAKATERHLLSPPLIVRFITELADILDGKEGSYLFKDILERIAKVLTLIRESVILVGDTLLRSPWSGNVLRSLLRIRRKAGVNYSLVGNVTPVKSKGIKEFLEELDDLELLILSSNPAVYMSEADLGKLLQKDVVALSLYPDLTANYSAYIVPAKLFHEREFVGFRNGFGRVFHTPLLIDPPSGAYTPWELLKEVFGVEADTEAILNNLGLSYEEITSSESGAEADLPPLEESEDLPEEEYLSGDGIFIVCDNGLVDNLGHWHLWTHGLEREQMAYVNPETADALGLGEEISLRGVSLKVKRTPNVAKNVIFVPASFDELQPFDIGIRPGRILKKPWLRIEEVSW